MKHSLLTILILALSFVSLHAQTLEEANQLYLQGNYRRAAEMYELVAEEQPSATVYYNLGNAYFKDSLLAKSIISYERCLRLDPKHEDAKHNLLFAEQHIVDRINESQTFFLLTWMQAFRDLMREHVWLLCSLVLFALFCALMLCFALVQSVQVRKPAFYVAWVALLFSIISLCCFSSLHQRDTQREEAIITQGIVNAKSAPDRTGTDLFTLHEGSKVTIKQTENDWVNIRIGSHEGWIPAKYLERI